MPTEPQGITIDQQELYRKVDLAVFTLANLMNIIMVIIFLSRAAGRVHSSIVGVIWIGFIVVLSSYPTLLKKDDDSHQRCYCEKCKQSTKQRGKNDYRPNLSYIL